MSRSTINSNINSEIDLLIEVLKGMRKQLASVTERFDDAVENDSKLKEYRDGKGLSS
tara:strand:+ start:50 stop:220 length:171 start_codon:yes stop_codon:yes gene_type:complete